MRCEKCGRIYPFVPDGQGQHAPQMQWTPTDVDNVLKTIDGLLNGLGDKFVTYKREEAQADNQFLQTAGSHNRFLLYAMLFFLAGMVGLMSYLASIKIVTGDALLFLAGTITAYVIVLIQRLIRWTNPLRPKEGE
jgi:hypothetical protein